MKWMLIFLMTFSSIAIAQRHGGGHGGGNREYRNVFHALLQNHTKIERTVKFTDKGVKTLTTSSDQGIARLLKKHVMQMKGLVESGRPIRRWDPLFAAIFEHHELIIMEIKPVANGIEVEEYSHDPFVAKLIQEHGKVVSLFVKHGFDEAHKPHQVPTR
jgi:hypothetical protein